MPTIIWSDRFLRSLALLVLMLFFGVGLIPDARAAEEVCTFLLGATTVESEVSPGPPPVIVVHLDPNSDGAGLKIEHVVSPLTTAVVFTAESGAVLTLDLSNETGQPMGGLTFEDDLAPWLDGHGYLPYTHLLSVFYTGISCGSGLLPSEALASLKAFFS